MFKTVADPFVGKLSYIKVVSGLLAPDSAVINMTSGQPEKIGKMLFLRGKKQDEVKEVGAGDLVAVTKLTALTGDTLCDPKRQVVFEKAEFPQPCYSLAVKTSANGDESKISGGIHRLLEEDPTLGFELNIETHQQILSGLGEQHLDVAVSKLKNKFGVSVELELPIIAYRETIRKKVKAEGKHKNKPAVTDSTAMLLLNLSHGIATIWSLRRKCSAVRFQKDIFLRLKRGFETVFSRVFLRVILLWG